MARRKFQLKRAAEIKQRRYTITSRLRLQDGRQLAAILDRQSIALPKSPHRPGGPAQGPASGLPPRGPLLQNARHRAAQAAKALPGQPGTEAKAKKLMQRMKKPSASRLKKEAAKKSTKAGAKTRQAIKALHPAKAARKQATKKAKQKARQEAAKKAVQTAKAAAKLTIRAVKAIAKGTVALVKSLAALIGTAGAVIVCILILGIIIALVASPFGIFFSTEDNSPEVTPIPQVVQQINGEFEAEIQAIKDRHKRRVDSIELHYSGSTDGVMVNNWMDVIAVFAVKTAMDEDNGMDVVTIDATRIALIREVFFDMNRIEWEIEEIEHEEVETWEDEDGNTHEDITVWYEYILYITITSKTAEEQAEDYGFTEEQKAILAEMLSGEWLSYYVALLGLGGAGLTEEELEGLINDLPPGELGSLAVEFALTRLGDPYSIPRAGTGDYTDCSHLVQWSYAKAGQALPRTASTQAKWCVDNDRVVAYSALVPGDLIFWSYGPSDRYLSIGHVGIYVGDGKVVHASSVEMQVVVEKVFHTDKIVMCGRP